MAILQEYDEINKKLKEEYGPNILKIREDYCNYIINNYSQDEVADNYVLNADKERYYEGNIVSKPLNIGHVYSGLTYDPELWKKFEEYYWKQIPHRYSDETPYSKRRYWYFTTHGVGPGTIPKDLTILEIREGQNKKGTWGDFICLDGVLNTSELKEFDLIELAPTDSNEIISQIKKVLSDINSEYDGIYDLDLRLENDLTYIIDHNEELYYGGFQFEKVLDRLEKALREIYNNNELYLDCDCPGRWIVGG